VGTLLEGVVRLVEQEEAYPQSAMIKFPAALQDVHSFQEASHLIPPYLRTPVAEYSF